MKLVLIVLVVLNFAVAAALRGWLGDDARRLLDPAQREPGRAQAQIAPGKLVLFDPASKPKTLACAEFGPMPADEAERLAQRVRAFGATVATPPSADSLGFIVLVPTLPSRADAERTAAELRGRGVEDLQVLPDTPGPLRNSISLGVFRTEDAANARLAALRARGVTTARLQTRPSAARAVVQVRDLPTAQSTALDAVVKDANATRVDAGCVTTAS